jgi:DNA-binding MarR family transcriptional regulator
MDKEHIILDAIDKNGSITQRELSKRVNLSLGSVNLLLNKMVKDGLIKINQIPLNRVVYMLTPKGAVEKVNKTYNYIKDHYRIITETKRKIMCELQKMLEREKPICIVLENDELSELVKVVSEGMPDIIFSQSLEGVDLSTLVVTIGLEKYNEIFAQGRRVINLLEKI